MRARPSIAPLPAVQWPSLLAAVTLLVGGCEPPPEEPPPEPHPSWRRERILVSDGDVGRLQVLDVEEDAVIADLPLRGPAAVAATESGDFATITIAGEDRVGFLRGGVSVSPHDDHVHIYKHPPVVLDFEVEGESRGAVVSRGGEIAVFFEGSAASAAPARAVVVEEKELRLASPSSATFVAAGPHRGAGVPVAGGLLLTRPAGGALAGSAEGVDLLDDAGEILDSISPGCPALEGAAAIGASAAFACEDGVLLVEPGPAQGSFTGSVVPYPGGGARARLLRPHVKGPTLVGDLGPFSLLHVDVTARTSARRDLGAPLCDFAIEPSTGSEVIALAGDGSLRVLHLGTGVIEVLAAVVDPFDCAAAGPRPHVAVAPGKAYVTSPGSGELLEVALRDMTIAARRSLGGAPSGVALLGLAQENIDLDTGVEH